MSLKDKGGGYFGTNIHKLPITRKETCRLLTKLGTLDNDNENQNVATRSLAAMIFRWVSIIAKKSSVGIATDYGLDGPGPNSGGDEIFPPVQTGPGVHPASCKMGTGSFLGVKCGRGVLLTTQPLLVPRSWKSRAIPLPTLWSTPGL